MTKQYAPRGLGKAGKKLWQDITHVDNGWDLRPDELRVLEDAAKMADLVDRLENVVAGLSDDELTVNGSRNQPVAHPLIAELRQGRATLATLLRQLRLTEEDETPTRTADGPREPMSRAEAARKAANARWSRSA
ncbi:hypothetical protein [Actinophytocola sp. NPDC049390]|uniref:hypothetical protein n=1 Tax=Actinophytocola sp. NPDC049390 TaxID=3363894 RepID=UPI0037A08461